VSNKNISALSSASTPLSGSEIVPINQSGVTDSVSVANLTAGRSVSASDYTASTGNFVPATAGQGINFTANSHAPGSTSKLLNDYEEGTWTPGFATWTTAPTQVIYNKYTKVGRLVTLNCLNRGGTTIAGNTITGLPFTPALQGSAAFITLLTGTPATIPGSVDGATASIQNLGASVFGTQYWTFSVSYSV